MTHCGIGGDPHDTARCKDVDGIRENLHGEQHVLGDHGHHDVELELPMFGCNRDGGVTPDDLKTDLIHHLRDRWIDLPRHDGRAGLHRW